MVVLGIGLLISIVCGLWMLVLQFQTSILWGLGCLVIPFVSLIWLIMYWDAGKKPFLISLVGVLLTIGGLFMLPIEA